MKKFYKTLVVTVLSLFIFSAITVPISAETESDSNTEETHEVSETDTVIELVPYEPTTHASFTGNRGIIRLDYMPSNGFIS